MLDYALTIAPHWHEALRSARTYEAEQRVWLGRLREIQRGERRAKARKPQTIVVSKPAHLAGVHKMWI